MSPPNTTTDLRHLKEQGRGAESVPPFSLLRDFNLRSAIGTKRTSGDVRCLQDDGVKSGKVTEPSRRRDWAQFGHGRLSIGGRKLSKGVPVLASSQVRWGLFQPAACVAVTIFKGELSLKRNSPSFWRSHDQRACSIDLSHKSLYVSSVSASLLQRTSSARK